MMLRMMCAVVSLVFVLPTSGLLQKGTTVVSVSSQGALRRPHHGGHKRRSKKHHRLHHHHSRHRHRHRSDSLEEKTSRPHCVSWKDEDRQLNDPLYQYADFTSRTSADAFFDDKKDAGRFATIQYANGALINTYGSLAENADQDNMALVCGISLSSTTPWSAKTECDPSEVVDTMSECQIAGPFLGFVFAGPVSPDDGTTPPGCHYVTADGTTSSYYNQITSASVTGGDPSVMAICRATTTRTPSASLSELDESLPVVRRSRLTADPQVDQNDLDARRDDAGAVETRAARDEFEPPEANIQLPPTFLRSRRTPPHQTGTEQETTDRPPSAPHAPSHNELVRKTPPRKVPDRHAVEPNKEAKQAAQAIKVLQELQEMKMQLELKQMEKKIRIEVGLKAGITNAPAPAKAPVSNSAAVLKVETTSAATLEAAATTPALQVAMKEQPMAPKVETTIAAVLKAKATTSTASHAAMEEEPCGDNNEFCGDWATKGECDKNADYMNVVCRAACKQCMGAP